MNYEFEISNHPKFGWKRKLVYSGNELTDNSLSVTFKMFLCNEDESLIQDSSVKQGVVIALSTSNTIPVDMNGNQLKDSDGNYDFASPDFYAGERDYLVEKGKTVPLYTLLEYYIGVNDQKGFFN